MNINVFVSLLLKGGSIIISLVLVPLTLNYLTNLEYGVWLTISSILHWIDYFDIGLANGLRNKLAEAISMKNMSMGKIYVSTTYAMLSLIVLILLCLYLFISPVLDWNEILNTGTSPIPNLNEIVLIVMGILCVNFVAKTIGTIYIAYQQPMINNLLSFIGNLISLIIIYILTLTTDGDIGKVAITFSIAPVLVYVFAYPYTFMSKFRDISPSFKCIRFSYSKSLIGLGMKFFILQIVCLILYSTSNILIARLFSPEDVTPYSIGYRYINIVMMIFTIVLTPLWTAITDAYTRKEYSWIAASIKRMYYIWLLFLIMIVVLILVSKPVIRYWTGGEVIVSSSLLIAIGAYILSLMFNNIYASFANGIGELRIQTIAAVLEGVIYIPLTLLLSKYFGVTGVAMALAVVSLIPCFMLYLYYKRTISKLINTVRVY